MKNSKLQGADSLPRCAISKRLQYEKQIKALHLFRLLSLEMLHRRVELGKKDFRKYSCAGDRQNWERWCSLGRPEPMIKFSSEAVTDNV